MKRIGFLYGISHFETLVKRGNHYVDRTMYLAKMEDLDTRYHFFLCPRRFGKSLAMSVMEYYSGKQHRDKFEELFGRYNIGQQPTAGATAYVVLKFDFSGIITSSLSDISKTFLAKVRYGVVSLMAAHAEYFDEEDVALIEKEEGAAQVMTRFF